MRVWVALMIAIVVAGTSAFAGDFPNWRLGLRTQIVSNDYEFIPKSPLDPGNKITFRPAASNYFGVALGYKWVAGTIWFSVKANDEIRALEGESKYTDMALSLFFQDFGFELHYGNFTGFLLKDSSRISAATLAGQTYYKLPDMQAEGGGFNLYFPLDGKSFSMSAAFDQSEMQHQSGGSFIILGSGRWQRISNSGAIIPAELQTQFGGDATLQTAQMFNLAAGMGYGHLWLPGPFFFTPFLGLSAGYQNTHYTIAGTTKDKGSPAVNLHFKLGFGLNKPGYFLTLVATADRFQQVTDSLEVGNTVISSTFSAGFRF